MRYDTIIIGAGQAGFTTALSLRKRKYNGSILLIGDEKYLPYQRPPLSKEFLSDQIETKRLFLKSEKFFKKNKIEVLTKSSVSKINKQLRTVVLKNKRSFNYGKVVLCTGSQIRKIKLSCNEKRIHYLRTISDAIEIKNSIKFSKEIVILGGGYIGLEIAAALIKKGLKVTIIEMENRLMKRSLSKPMALFLQNKHLSEGVDLLLNTSVIDIKDLKGKKKIICNTGITLDADAVVIGVGIEPNIALAASSDIKYSNGIEVDENGRTSDQNIFAAGDCTWHPNNIFNKRIRLESVQNAMDQAKTVAASIMGEQEPYNKTPWFWSDQYNLKLSIAGLIHDYDSQFIDGEMEDDKFAIFFIKNNRLVGVEAINHQKAFLKGRKLITAQIEMPEEKINLSEMIYKN